jgi:Methyltransferase domain
VIFEAGCGVGNAMFPILAENENPNLKIHGRDYSPRAIEVLRSDPQFDPLYATADVWDVASDSLPEGIPESSVDVITLCFVLSALVSMSITGVMVGTESMGSSYLQFISPLEAWWTDMFSRLWAL